jgi:thiol:disulfide interchange protein DsbD
MEHTTFSDPKVAAAMKRMRLLQVDVTANSDEQRALLKKFNLFGPPGIVLFNAAGKEVAQGRVIGFVPPETFLRQLARTRDEA